ncbi:MULTISPECIES: TOBE domain-containing protein [Sulfurimonas]|uniref:TOBE domain-containing protein n=1 Tax=Sulfurimonas diazotrophicus TaxID=3131939 RepID=A0ABZ3H9Q2_9BACT
MMISARNQIDADIVAVRRDGVSALLELKTAQGTLMFASITGNASDTLCVKEGDRVIAFFKDSHVLVATGWAIPISARNRLEGTIETVHRGVVNAEVRIRLGGGDRISATVTDDAVSNLELQSGMPVVAIIKASDMMIAKPAK